MILVDTSVVIDALRKPDPKLQSLFHKLSPAICGVVVAEILHGARDQADYTKLVAVLTAFPKVAMPRANAFHQIPHPEQVSVTGSEYLGYKL